MENTEKTFGKHLRELTDQAKARKELEGLKAVLEEKANEGINAVQFPDLRSFVPTMISNGTIWNWFKENDITFDGTVDTVSGAYNYKLAW